MNFQHFTCASIILALVYNRHVSRFTIRTGWIYQAEMPVRNELYQLRLKRFLCLLGGAKRETDPKHTGPHGRTKACDWPVCRCTANAAGNLAPTHAPSPSVNHSDPFFHQL